MFVLQFSNFEMFMIWVYYSWPMFVIGTLAGYFIPRLFKYVLKYKIKIEKRDND